MECEYSYSAYGTRTVVNGYESVLGYCARDGVLTENGGLCYMRARYYSPELMRFVNQDIVVGDISNSNSLNRYTYVEGNPATMVDPFGLCPNKANPGKIVDGVVGTGKGFCETAIGAAAVVAGGAIITVAGAPVVIVGGLLLVGAGAISMIFGSGDMAEGIIDIGKGIVGDDSKTYNVGRDYLCGGDQQLYDTVEIGSMLVCGYGIGAANSYVASQSSSSGSITQNAKVDAASIGSEGSNTSKPYTNSRPSFRTGVVEEAWENAKGPDGLVRDPNTGEIINWTPGESRKGVWDMGHIPEAKYSEMHEAYMNGEMTTKEFVDWYNEPANYRPELPGNNRSHRYE